MATAGFAQERAPGGVVLHLAEQPVMRPPYICTMVQINRGVTLRAYPVLQDVLVDEQPRLPVAEAPPRVRPAAGA